MKTLVKRGIELLLIAAVLTIGLALMHPLEADPENAAQRLSLDEAVAMQASGVVLFADARPPAVYEEAHIPGALSLSEDDWEAGLAGFLEAWSPETMVIVYCDSSACRASEQVAARLRAELEIENVRVLEGGWEAWQQSGQPIASSQP